MRRSQVAPFGLPTILSVLFNIKIRFMKTQNRINRRGTTPLGYASFEYHYEQEEKESPKDVFYKLLEYFSEESAEFEEMSKKHVYDNPDASQWDFNSHCAWIADLIHKGQILVLYAEKHSLSEQLDSELADVRRLVDHYIFTLHDWHGKQNHADEPASFKKAMDELAEGKLEPFDL